MPGSPPPSPPEPAGAAPARPPWLPTLIVAITLFMETMEATAVATALPQMARDFGEGPVAMKLALTVYMVGLAIFIPVSTWLAERHGTRTVFRAAIALFIAGSLGCAVAPGLGVLVAARFVQAMGGAMMVPVGRLVLLKTVPKDQLVVTLSRLAMPAMFGPVLGPAIGGLVTTHGHWRAIFAVNLPIALFAWWLAARHVPQVREERTRPLDRRGFVLCSLGLGCLSLGLTGLGQPLLPGGLIALLCTAGVLGLAGYALHAARVAHPLLDLRLLQLPTLAAGVLGGSVFRIGIGAMPFLLSLMFQLAFGLDAAQTGWLMMTGGIAALGMKTVAAAVLRRFGFRRVLLGNGVLAALSMAACGALDRETAWAAVVAVLLAGGFFRSIQFTALHSISYADVPQARLGAATALASSAQQMSQSVGVTLGAQALTLSAAWGGRAAPALADFQLSFVVIGACAALSLWWPWRLHAAAGAALARRDAGVAG